MKDKDTKLLEEAYDSSQLQNAIRNIAKEHTTHIIDEVNKIARDEQMYDSTELLTYVQDIVNRILDGRKRSLGM